MTTPIPLRIKVTSDTICPFCFIGLRKLQRALATSPVVQSKAFDVDIEYLPFQLDPTLPVDRPESKLERYRAKFGARTDGMVEMMKGRGLECGIHFSYGGPIRSTLLSHRLLSKSYLEGGSKLQLALIEKLFHSYFEQEGDPGDIDTLASLSGPPPSFLESKELLPEVEKKFHEARLKGISGVPHFEIEAGQPEGKRVRAEVGGAQDSEAFVEIFGKIKEAIDQQQ
ncbi:uncharacterized protein PSFLO_06393 [Pseudozyma flocculosa]|uniref:DSBA-like thioredoxin domain-containing protein n=1 Tax=Pseudozyma flocculosa TaxID=84751 RepID=A0A5C3FBN7_9BASI|nr:uncharacterized protein PSFLO_06393 [Pseudozyma flocculosa]